MKFVDGQTKSHDLLIMCSCHALREKTFKGGWNINLTNVTHERKKETLLPSNAHAHTHTHTHTHTSMS